MSFGQGYSSLHTKKTEPYIFTMLKYVLQIKQVLKI